ncbi:hypothetical protein [Limnoglobus roseus]|uniref:Uncharacterized protein n=1 Tax=Limnoglobus roseus TaxID=2598579 RepID=A0A5C1A8C5_9BACT|nr:hypothetical protein [Limnoglobus roseus]QEL14256.1 hypothetical protein PX52LOC_01126 [Limnoglobus roseus]
MLAASTFSLFVLLANDAATRIRLEPKTAAEFYRLYKSYDLWLPPPNAQLVRLGSGEDARYEILPSPPGIGVYVPVRGWYGEGVFGRLRMSPAEFSIGLIEKGDWNGAEDLLFLAAIGQHLGRTEFAAAAFERARQKSGYLTQSADWEKGSPGFTSGLLRERVWSENLSRLADPRGDREQARRHLQRVYDEDGQFRSVAKTQLLEDLSLTLREREPSRDPIERKIDRLVEWSGTIDARRYSPRLEDPITPYDEVAQCGFEAVPYLIAHLDDRRLTRSPLTFVFNRLFSQDVCRVGDVCLDLLKAFAARELRDQGGEQTLSEWRERAGKWFERAKAVGEEEWYATKAMSEDPVSLALCRAFAERYPKRFAASYKNLLARAPKVYSGNVVIAMAHGRLPKGEKLDLLTLGAAHERLEHRLEAVKGLFFLDPGAGRQAIPGYFKRVSAKEADERYESVLHDEIGLVMAANDASCWQAFRDHFRTCSPTQRVYYVGSSGPVNHGRPVGEFKRWSQEIEPLWDDAAVRVLGANQKVQDFAPAYPSLAVADFITLAFAEELGVAVPTDRNRTAAEWKKVREKVASALQQASSQSN